MSGTPLAGVKEALGALRADLAGLARVRLDLLALELKEASQWQKEMLLLAAIAIAFLLAGLMAIAVLVVVVFWDTHRIAAIAAVCAVYAGVGGWAVLRLRDRVRNGLHPFSGTLAEFRRDLDMLREPE